MNAINLMARAIYIGRNGPCKPPTDQELVELRWPITAARNLLFCLEETGFAIVKRKPSFEVLEVGELTDRHTDAHRRERVEASYMAMVEEGRVRVEPEPAPIQQTM